MDDRSPGGDARRRGQAASRGAARALTPGPARDASRTGRTHAAGSVARPEVRRPEVTDGRAAGGGRLAGAGPRERPVPVTKAARQAQISAILADPLAPVRSQDELASRLGGRDVWVTQATLSRDLDELGAVRLRDASGVLVYALPAGAVPDNSVAGAATDAGAPSGPPVPAGAPGARLTRIAAELLLSAAASGNLAVLHTPPGAAQLLASAIDLSGWRAVLGTVAGDDTVIVVASGPAGGDQVARSLRQMAERRPEVGARPVSARPGGPRSAAAGSARSRGLARVSG